MPLHKIENLQIAEEAADWAITLDAGDLSEKQSRDLAEWLLASPRHVEELLINSAILCGLEDIDADQQISLEELLAAKAPEAIALFPSRESDASDAADPAELHDESEPAGHYASNDDFGSGDLLGAPARWAVAAMLALVVIGISALVMVSQPADKQAELLAFASDANQQRLVTLEDGSVVRLSSNTQVRIGYSDDSRFVFLDEGEAIFSVEHDPERPFRVFAGGTLAEALGTTFTVQREGDYASVSVLEGKVGVSQISDASGGVDLIEAPDKPPSIVLSAGERSELDVGTGRIVKMERQASGGLAAYGEARPGNGNPSAGLASATAEGMSAHGSGDPYVEFSNATLAEIASRFNRHNRVQIRIVDQSLASKRFSGIFEADDPQSFVEFLTISETAKVTRIGQELRLSEPGN